MPEIIEYLEIIQAGDSLKSRRRRLDKKAFIELILKEGLPGATAIVSIKGLPQLNAFLMLGTKNGAEAPNELTVYPWQPLLQHAQVLIYPILHSGGRAKNAAAGKPQHLPLTSGHGKSLPVKQSSKTAENGKITESQRRYLFRLLAEKRNLQGKQADNYLKEQCRVKEVDEIPKSTASDLIQTLLGEGS